MPAEIGPSGPRPFSTHGITVEAEIAVKRYGSPVGDDDRRLYGDEPRREWRALGFLARYAPGLAPKPMAEHGESLKDLVNRALAHELGLPSVPKQKTGRVTLPLIARDAAATVLVTNDDIADALDAEDVERYTQP
jgi:hypothetical protein